MRTITFLIGFLILGISTCPARAHRDPGFQIHYEAHQSPRCVDATRPEVVGLDPENAVERSIPSTFFNSIKTAAEFESTVHHSHLSFIPRLYIKIRVLRN